MKKMDRMDKLALLDSEIFQELEQATRKKQAQSFTEKALQTPAGQKAITDGVTKALSQNQANDGKMNHEEIKTQMKKLTDHELFEVAKMFNDEVEARGLDSDEYEKEFDEEEELETEEDEEKEDEELGEVFAYVKSSLVKLARNSADSGNTEAAYLIERFVQKISSK